MPIFIGPMQHIEVTYVVPGDLGSVEKILNALPTVKSLVIDKGWEGFGIRKGGPQSSNLIIIATREWLTVNIFFFFPSNLFLSIASLSIAFLYISYALGAHITPHSLLNVKQMIMHIGADFFM